MIVLLKGKPQNAYNIANPSQEISVIDLAKLLANLRKDVSLKVNFDKQFRGDSYLQSKLLKSLPSIKKANAIGFNPVVNLKNGFSRTIESFLTL